MTLEGLTFHELAEGISYALLALAAFYVVTGLDDLVLDVVAWLKRLGPRELSAGEVRELGSEAPKRLAILVPAWREARIIRRMLIGNASQIDYASYHIFVGVYPNDPQTMEEVRRAAALYPNIHAVVNDRPGPTSKGQILNAVLRAVLETEKGLGYAFEGFLLHDAEDVIHPRALSLINRELGRYDFIQIPIFSFPVAAAELVAGTYVDEFAENHTKDLLVREHLGAAIPSAGVGTALSRRLVTAVTERQGGRLFNESALTEDYELGIQAHALGFVPHVSCHYTVDADGTRDYIATREFFPRTFSRSVRQKTRWNIGIALLAWQHLGWPGSPMNRYFLLRDRKAIFTHALTAAGYLLLALSAVAAFLGHGDRLLAAFATPWAGSLLVAAPLFMVHRAFVRAWCIARVYGWRTAAVSPLRAPVANLINAIASVRAVYTCAVAYVEKAQIGWQKTEHELPEYFGHENPGVEIRT